MVVRSMTLGRLMLLAVLKPAGPPQFDDPLGRDGMPGGTWFADRVWRMDYPMTRFMDRRVEGTLGGSALRYPDVIVDYPAAVAWFSP
jgi:hypothetical protein